MELWSALFVASTALAALGFAGFAVLWLRKLRRALCTTFEEAATAQTALAQDYAGEIDNLRQQQVLQDGQIQALIESNLILRHELAALAGKVEIAVSDPFEPSPHRTVH